MINHVAAARGPCIDPPSAISTPAAYVQSLVHNPALKVTRPTAVTIGGLSGFVVDLRIRKTWKKACPWSHGQPYVQTITDLAPKLSQLDHGVIPQPMVMRLYLLGYRGGTIGIEVDALQGSAKLAAYSAVVKTFRFATARARATTRSACGSRVARGHPAACRGARAEPPGSRRGPRPS